MGVCRLQGNRAKCGTAQESLQRRRPRVLARREGPNSSDVFVTLARAYEEIKYSHCSAASLLPCNPVQKQGGVISLFFSWHHTAHHIPQTPRNIPDPDMGVQDLPTQWLGSVLDRSASLKPTKTFLSTLSLPVCNHGLQLSALTSPQGGFLSNSPQFCPLILQVTSNFPPDFTFSHSCIILLSVPKFH